MKIIESCPRCGVKVNATMESHLLPGDQICFKCAEEEIFSPQKAKKKMRQESCMPLWFSEAYLNGRPPPRQLAKPQGLYMPIHLGHAVKTNMAICSYQRFSADRITTNPNEVTCLNCLRRIRKQHGRASDQV